MNEITTFDVSWARRITERLRLQATNYQEAREKVIATLTEARDGGAAELLGYASWTAYMADVFADAPLRLERDARQELVAELAAEGMSTRDIAPIVGVSREAVRKDLATDNLLSVATTLTVMQVNPSTGEVEDVPAREVTGHNGKSYAVPVHRTPNRRALTDSARDAGWDIRKATEKIQRIREDDRFSSNKEEVASLLRGHLTFVIETCQGILDDLDQSQED